MYVAQRADSRWQLSVGGTTAGVKPSFGWAQSYTVASPGEAVFEYRTPLARRLLVAAQVVLWGLAIVIAATGGVPRRRQSQVAAAGPAADLGVAVDLGGPDVALETTAARDSVAAASGALIGADIASATTTGTATTGDEVAGSDPTDARSPDLGVEPGAADVEGRLVDEHYVTATPAAGPATDGAATPGAATVDDAGESVPPPHHEEALEWLDSEQDPT